MTTYYRRITRLFLVLLVLWLPSLVGTRGQAQSSVPFVYGDPRPDAPALARRGPFGVGVRTVLIVHLNQVDILHATLHDPVPRYDRPLTLEVWYPAIISHGRTELTTYTDILPTRPDAPPRHPYHFLGRALRNATPNRGAQSYPLVIVSHGYPGSRVMMSYLTENLASKGYVVVAIDHTDSTHADKAAFASTLLNRSFDDLFVLNQVGAAAHGGGPASLSFLNGLVDDSRTALIGYSMGGYGVLNAAGAGYSDQVQPLVGGNLTSRLESNLHYPASIDPRIKAVVAFAPWGGRVGMWDPAGLAGLRVPMLFVDGDQDDVAGYTDGVRRLFDGAVNADRYLLVYENARHNIAPNPPPPVDDLPGYEAYGEFAWDSARINNINQHFVTAFLGIYLKGEDDTDYLSVSPQPQGSDWKGFPPRTTLGLELWHDKP